MTTEILMTYPNMISDMNYPRRVERMNAMHLMNQYPAKSGWIRLLHNRVNLASMGNRTYSLKVWYDARTRKVGRDDKCCDKPFRTARIRCKHPSAGWMYMEDYYRYKNQ